MMKDLKEKDDILRATDGGLKVFQHYLGDKVVAGVKFKNPFYTDTIASCNLYYGKTCGRYFLVDFGDSGERGDCFWFVAKWENLDYHNDFEEILRVIDNELCLNIFKDDKKPVTQKSEKPKFVATIVPSNSNTILPFTRMINGAADYTICYYDKRLRNTHGHQLAASMVYYAPLLTVLWYDTPERYQGEPEIQWFEQLPTVWDETRVIDGAPGEGIVIMRRKGSDYYLAVMGNNERSTKDVSLDFLPAGQSYKATIYEDDEQVATATHIRISERKVKSKQSLRFTLQPRGGAVVKFRRF